MEKKNFIHKMKQPTAPIYPELPSKDGQNYRLQKISEIEKQLIKERDVKESLYKKYNRAINFTEAIDTTLISTSVIMAGIGLVVPVMLPLEIAAIVCGYMDACGKLVRCKLMSKAQKHYEIKTIGESRLNSVKNLTWLMGKVRQKNFIKFFVSWTDILMEKIKHAPNSLV